jgi:transcriptional regulator with PAS, ATPase and Fis domain
MPLYLQPKLLRALQEKEIERLGGKESIPVDIRIIAASNVSLEKLVQRKKFRMDLFYRLNVLKIVIPPLRERKEDIPSIVENLIDKLNYQLGMNVPGISDEAKNKFVEIKYDWPGNIRELQNIVERGMNKSWGKILEWEHFKEYFENKKTEHKKLCVDDNEASMKEMKENLEKKTIIKTLKNCDYNKTQAAKVLGISRTALYKKFNKYGIEDY